MYDSIYASNPLFTLRCFLKFSAEFFSQCEQFVYFFFLLQDEKAINPKMRFNMSMHVADILVFKQLCENAVFSLNGLV